MSNSEAVTAAAWVLTLHQRMDGPAGNCNNCMCGQLRLGDSYPRHLAQVLDGAGLLREHVVTTGDTT